MSADFVPVVGLDSSTADPFAPRVDRMGVETVKFLLHEKKTTNYMKYMGVVGVKFIRGRMAKSPRRERKREGFGPVLAQDGDTPTTAKTDAVLVRRRNCWFCWGF